MSTEPPAEHSAEERLKYSSNYLRGSIEAGLADPVTGAVSEGDAKLLKFHGTYLQDDRDLRLERMEQKLEPAYQFMVRVRMPGGVCTPEQWLRMDELARRYGRPSLRITTRQTFQFHGILKRDLKATIAGINHALLSTVAACGDVNRNVVCHNNPYLTPLHAAVYEQARRLSDRFLPGTRAYHEIWLDGEKVAGSEAVDEEPVYGRTYMPRKFKMGLTVPPYNEVDVYAQDLGFIAVADSSGTLEGYNVVAGGGMGMSRNEPETYPRTASVVGFCTPEQVLEVAEAMVLIQRDFGDRANRKHARFKYTIDDRGVGWLREEVGRRLGWPLAPARPVHLEHNLDPHGWVRDTAGFWHLTLNVLSGRIEGDLMDVLREIAEAHRGDFRLTCNQNVTIARIASEERTRVEGVLARRGIAAEDSREAVWRSAMSCVALPTCGLAMAESERMLPAFIERITALAARLGIADVPITLRVTGCPNGCARPYLAEIALVGKSLGQYDMYLGADPAGSRMNRLYRRSVSEDAAIAELEPLLERFAAERGRGERFGDFAVRKGWVIPVATSRDFNRDA
jgi:sulfite reductase (NADPH) hemoprotein beta-component